MKKIFFVLAVFVFMSACATMQQANMDWIPIGPEFPAKKSADEIEIFTDKEQLTRPYGNVGLLRIKNLEPDRDTLKRGVQRALRFAASKGGDAVFLGQYNSAEDESPEPKVTLFVYVLKYGDNLTDEDKKALAAFELEGALNNSITF